MNYANEIFTIIKATVYTSVISLIFISCGSSSVETRTVDSSPSDTAASPEAIRVLSFISSHSTGSFSAVISGQNCGHGSQIADTAHMMSYNSIISDLAAQTGKYPGIIGVDYEHDRIFTPAQLTACNAILIDYWKKGGLVTINWAPHNPWLNDESDIEGNYGTWTDTRNNGTNLDKVNLSDLVNPSSAIHPIWRKKLDRIASALAELQSAGVTVLWRPLQEMNGDWFWWGTATSPNSGTPYKNIYIDMFRYFTEVKGLHNLLWVFSPCQYAGTNSSGIHSCDKFYPGNEYVDIVAGTLYNNALAIGDYNTYCSFGKPVGMAELGAASWDTIAKTGQFDNRQYESIIRKNYPAIAYWVSWHNWDNGDGTFSWMSLNKNKYPKECMENGGVITRDELPSFKE